MPTIHASGEGKSCSARRFLPFAKQFASETWLAHPASAGWFRTPAGNARIHEISSVPQSCSLIAASACQGPPSEFSTYFSDAPADQSQEGLEIASGVGPGLALSEHGPCLIGGTVTLDDVSFTTKLAIHSLSLIHI